MELLTKQVFETLSHVTAAPCVSIYLPTHLAGAEIQQDPIRLKNLLKDAEMQLQQKGWSGAIALLQPAWELLEDSQFWRQQNQGLALLLTTNGMHTYRLPLTFEPQVVVGERFYLKPLMRVFTESRDFYILALSQNQVRLFQATHHCMGEVALTDMQTSLAEVLQYDEPEKQLQFHNVSGSGSTPMYHGHGVGTTDEKESIRRFCRAVDEGLQSHLNGETAPLVLAAVEFVQAIYREVNSYPHVLESGINGNPETLSPEELHQAGWEKIAPLLERSHQSALERFNTLHTTNQASDRLEQIVPAACYGQVELLLIAANHQQWGQFDSASGTVSSKEQTDAAAIDLLDLAATQTWLQGGTVYRLPPERMPSNAAIAAIYRYDIPAETYA